MVDFKIVDERVIPLADLPSEELTQFVAHWNRIRGDRPFPLRGDFDPTEIPKLLQRVRLVDIEPNGVFRFRLYSTTATNPDQRDMTGLTTDDYRDKGFAAMVTRHYATVAEDGEPRCWHIKASVESGEYEYIRVVLPLSRKGEACDMLLVKSIRITNPFVLWR